MLDLLQEPHFSTIFIVIIITITPLISSTSSSYSWHVAWASLFNLIPLMSIRPMLEKWTHDLRHNFAGIWWKSRVIKNTTWYYDQSYSIMTLCKHKLVWWSIALHPSICFIFPFHIKEISHPDFLSVLILTGGQQTKPSHRISNRTKFDRKISNTTNGRPEKCFFLLFSEAVLTFLSKR